MHFWNQQAIDRLFTNLSANSFRPATDLEIALGLGGLLCAAFLIYWSARRVRERHSGARRALSSRMTARLQERLALAPSERDLAGRLAGTLPEPAETGYQVLARPEVFRVARRSYLAENPESGTEVTAFSTRLDFPVRPDGLLLENTAEIPPETILTTPSEDRMVLAESEPIGLWVLPLDARPRLGHHLHLQFRRSEGLYRFVTTPVAERDGRFLLEHVPNLERLQRRRAFRYPIGLPVEVEGMDTHTINVGAGGALVAAVAGLEPAAGESLALRIPELGLGVPEAISAETVHAGPEGWHLRFVGLRPGLEDRLLRRLRERMRAETADEGGGPRGASSANA